MYSSALYQVLLLVLIIASIALIFVLVRMYLILTDLNDSSRKIKIIVDDVCSTVTSIKSSVSEYQTIIKGFIITLTSISGIKELINKFQNKSEERE